ncbi:MAG TPA: TIGR03118 family protein [Verrucomicrobiota bacterium]|nr:TIGR03118 family protein [Verrucomicrobiales bacterium]HRI11491.1 TIGR03118 family protein [Verrucomicrobiota bacterium]
MKASYIRSFLLPGALALGFCPKSLLARSFIEHDLVSDIPGRADHTDPNLSNPWGISLSPTSPFWVADNKTGVSTLYDGEGVPRSLVVSIPPPGGGTPPASPTGTVFNGGSGFEVAPGLPARFLFATEDGTISGWNPAAAPTAAILKVDHSGTALYKGLAIGNNGSADHLYAANFKEGSIDVFDTAFAPASLSGSFTDPTLPAGYAPFNIQNLGGKLYVTYALQDGGQKDDVPGAGHGFVDVFDLNGNLLQRLVSQGALNSPWGLVIGPEDFGPFEGDLLVGNFGDGRINAYDLSSGKFLGSLKGPDGKPIEIEGLWALTAGNGANGGDEDDLYFTAGISDEEHGLFGEIGHRVPETGNRLSVLFGALTIGLLHWRRAQAR